MSNPSIHSVQKSASAKRRMRRQRHLQGLSVVVALFACALLASGSLTHTVRAEQPQNAGGLASGPGTVPILVKFKATATAADIDNAEKGSGGQKARAFDKLRTHVLNVPAAARDAVIAALSKQAAVERVSAAVRMSKAGDPNDSGYAGQWALPKMA